MGKIPWSAFGSLSAAGWQSFLPLLRRYILSNPRHSHLQFGHRNQSRQQQKLNLE
jgi:hypothetical protein